MIIERNEGAKRANDKMHQRRVKDKLDAIYEELRLLRKATESLAKAKAKKPDETDYHGEAVS